MMFLELLACTILVLIPIPVLVLAATYAEENLFEWWQNLLLFFAGMTTVILIVLGLCFIIKEGNAKTPTQYKKVEMPLYYKSTEFN